MILLIKRKPFSLASFGFGWPKPDIEVLTIDFVSAMTECFPFLIALTTE